MLCHVISSHLGHSVAPDVMSCDVMPVTLSWLISHSDSRYGSKCSIKVLEKWKHSQELITQSVFTA